MLNELVTPGLLQQVRAHNGDSDGDGDARAGAASELGEPKQTD